MHSGVDYTTKKYETSCQALLANFKKDQIRNCLFKFMQIRKMTRLYEQQYQSTYILNQN